MGRRPRALRNAQSNPQSTHIRLPCCRPGREKLGWTLPFAFGPRHDVNREPIQGKPNKRPGWRPRVELAEPMTKVATHVAHHFRGCKSSPDRFAVRRQAGNPIDQGLASLRIKE